MIYVGLFTIFVSGFGYGFVVGRYYDYLSVGDVGGMMDAFHEDLVFSWQYVKKYLSTD